MSISYGTTAAANRVFVALGLSFAAVLVGAALSVRHVDSGLSFVMLGFSLVWFSVAGVSWLGGSDPLRLVAGRFDEDQRRFVLTAADGTSCAIPYRELDSFDVRRHVSTGKHKRVSFIVYALKRDGGFWDLQSFGDNGLAQELLCSLQGSVSLAAARADEPEPASPLPDAFRRADIDGVARYTWKNQERLRDSLFEALLGAGLVMTMVGIPAIMTGAHTFFWGLSAVIILWIASRVYRRHGRTYQLEISNRFLTYSTRERGAAGFQVKRVLYVEEVARLQSIYELGLSQQERSHQLTFVGEKDVAHLRERRLNRDNAETTKSAAKLDRAIMELELPGVRTSDVLRLEVHLQAELARRGQAVA